MRQVLVAGDNATENAKALSGLADDIAAKDVSTMEQAISLLDKEGADIVFVEMQALSEEGCALLSNAASVCPKPRIIVLTSIDQPEQAIKLMKLGVNEFLIRPSDMKIFWRTMRQMLSRPGCSGIAT